VGSVHPEIIQKLEQHPAAVKEMALKAIELSASSSDAAVFDALKNWTRELVRREAQGE